MHSNFASRWIAIVRAAAIFTRAGVITCVAAIVALSLTYRTAQAQIRIVDTDFYKQADSVIEEVGGILKTETCLFEYRAEELTKRLNDTIAELDAANHTAFQALETKHITGDQYLGIWSRAVTRRKASKALIRRIKAFPRCLNFIGSPPGRFKMQDERLEIGDARMRGPQVQLATVSWTGPFIGVQLAGSFSSVTTSEFFAATGERTNQFDDTGSGFGGGVNVGFNWQPWSNNVVVGAVFDINGLNDSVRHDFPGGNYIGSVVNFTGSALVRGGVLVTPNALLFGQGGFSIANQQLKIDFGGPETNESQWTPGFTLGFGGELKLPAPVLPIGKATSVFVDYKRTWWSTANLTMPVASPLFNYGWQRQTDGIDIGLRFRW